MYIRIHVSQRAAIAAGVNEYGPMTVCVDVSALTDEQREEMLRCVSRQDLIWRVDYAETHHSQERFAAWLDARAAQRRAQEAAQVTTEDE